MNEFGTYLKQVRNALGLSLRDVEQRTNRAVTNGYISQLESGAVKAPSVRVLHALSDAYGVSYADLMRRAGLHVPETSPGSSARKNDPLASLPHRAIEELSAEEENELLQYLQFIRSRRQG